MLSRLKASEPAVVWVRFEVALNTSEQFLLDLSWNERPALRKQLLNEVVEVDLLEALVSNELCKVSRPLAYPCSASSARPSNRSR